MTKDESDWRFPEKGTPYAELEETLQAQLARNIDYEKDVVLGFPGTTPLPEAVKAFGMFIASHPNNIGLHTLEGASERGFDGTQLLEKEAVYMAAHLVGAREPETEIDGYICSGGTAGNDHGLWLGMQKLMCEAVEGKQGITVIASNMGHYSIVKNYGRLLQNGMLRKDDHQLLVLTTNSVGELTPDIVEAQITECLETGYRRFFLVLTAGTTNLGSVDQIEAINNRLLDLQDGEPNLKVHIHVDAAFGGFVLPFTEPELRFGFENPLVQSIIIDAHKMGYAPYPAGIFLARKGLLDKHCVTEAPYIKGHNDYTVCGSRPGTSAAAVWTAFRTLGREGYAKRIQECMENMGYLRAELQKFNQPGNTNVSFYPARMNIQTVQFSLAMTQAFRYACATYGKDLCLPDMANFPVHLISSPIMAQNGGGITAHRFLATPTLTREKIDIFLRMFREEWAKINAQIAT